MYLDTCDKTECFGCEACNQICGMNAVSMIKDSEGFRYPVIDKTICVNCGMCKNVCPYAHMPKTLNTDKYVFGGYNLNPKVRFESTSGGAFSAIVEAFCDDHYSAPFWLFALAAAMAFSFSSLAFSLALWAL